MGESQTLCEKNSLWDDRTYKTILTDAPPFGRVSHEAGSPNSSHILRLPSYCPGYLLSSESIEYHHLCSTLCVAEDDKSGNATHPRRCTSSKGRASKLAPAEPLDCMGEHEEVKARLRPTLASSLAVSMLRCLAPADVASLFQCTQARGTGVRLAIRHVAQDLVTCCITRFSVNYIL